MGQQTRFYTIDEAVEAASKYTRVRNRPLKIWEYQHDVRALAGAVQPDGTLVKPPKEVASVVEALCKRGHDDLADELLGK
jgi:hypothetical protein